MLMEVEATTDASGRPRPCSFRLGARTVDIDHIDDWWPGADHTYVKLTAADGATYILRHDAPSDRWTLTQYARSADDVTPCQSPEGTKPGIENSREPRPA